MNLTHQQLKESSDEQIVAQCTTGNAAAWEEFISRFGRLIYSVAVRRGCKNADAEEVFQQTLTLAWQHLSQLKEIAGLRSWLVTTALRECWRVQRTTSKHDGAELLPGDRVVADSDLIDTWERQDILRRALAELGDPCNALLIDLFNREKGEGYERIARRHEISIGSIGPTRGRCFTKLRRILGKMGLQQI